MAGIPQAAPVRVKNPVPEGAGAKTDEMREFKDHERKFTFLQMKSDYK